MGRVGWVLVMGFALLVGGAQSLGTTEVEAAIRRVIVAMTEGFNRHDARAATAMYLADGEFVSVRSEMATGAADVASTLAGMFATRSKAATPRTLDVKIRFIRPDVPLVHVTNELSGLIGASGQTLPPHQELSLRVFVKGDDEGVAFSGVSKHTDRAAAVAARRRLQLLADPAVMPRRSLTLRR